MSATTMDIVWSVLNRAIDDSDIEIIEACQRIIVAKRLGWQRRCLTDDWNLVLAANSTAGEDRHHKAHELAD